ncbi:hypothetical protein [Pseudomonas viridiflava]|uniref:hypothetical protein n=5 Tax=Pseudomonas viridiflava TaxID=33069 RepID=UPI000F010B59|nr:hypothetical protein [Pseudomonas viridiflava]
MMMSKEVFVVRNFQVDDGSLKKHVGQTFISTAKTVKAARNVLFHSQDWAVSERRPTYKIADIEILQRNIENMRIGFDHVQAMWEEWNLTFISLIRDQADWLVLDKVPLCRLSEILNSVPCSQPMSSRFKNMWYELGEEDGQEVSPRSLFCMLRFLPALEQKESQIGFFLDEETGRFGVNLSERLDGNNKKTLDLVFNENGEVYFTFIEGGDGYSRISGSSYLTDYLVNSSKFRKLINIFDY